MNKICSVLILMLLLGCSVKQKGADGGNGTDGKSAVKTTITSAELKEIVSYFASDELEGRDTGSEGIQKAATYASTYFKDHGIKPYFNDYLDRFKVGDVETFNVVGYLEGTDPDLKDEFVIIGAHFDHIGEAKEVNGDKIANGANDNAAGSAAVMTLAKHFGEQKSNKRSVLFVLFGAEERGLLGSKHLASLLKEKGMKLYTMLNFEMIGVPLVDKDYIAYLTGYEKSNLADKMNEYGNAKLVGYLPTAKKYQLFFRSDNYPFFKEFNVPCQTFCTFDFTNFDYYHHVDDEADKLDYKHMARLVNEFIPGVAGVINSEAGAIKLK